MTGRPQSALRMSFGSLALNLASGELHHKGQKIPLPPKVFELLTALMERPGEVVTREELRVRLWPADTFVEFDDSLNHAVKRLRKALGDTTDSPQFIETLPRRGYRFVARAEQATITQLQPEIDSLAVLPLANLSDDPQQEYFADGMTDALITNLSKIRAVKVISRTSVMQYKGARKPLPQIAQELGVEVVIEGTVQRSDSAVKITVQLIHAATDTHLWAENYEGDFRDVLALQGEVAWAVARDKGHARAGGVSTPCSSPVSQPGCLRGIPQGPVLLARAFSGTSGQGTQLLPACGGKRLQLRAGVRRDRQCLVFAVGYRSRTAHGGVSQSSGGCVEGLGFGRNAG
jgi:TolB-like protein